MIGPMTVAAGLGKAALVAAATRPLRLPLLAAHGAAIVATHVVAGALLGGMAVTLAALAARQAMRQGHHRR
ncbi:hypothetical protein ACE7GA_23320 [Roseomonas sp. CCTCC AB2023176]|uniref:hypothetical protein n=1 Tax=Roseomonas sp. CCTCC AB2023176 TaxID=3342640 RepID=UPI0035E26E1C